MIPVNLCHDRRRRDRCRFGIPVDQRQGRHRKMERHGVYDDRLRLYLQIPHRAVHRFHRCRINIPHVNLFRRKADNGNIHCRFVNFLCNFFPPPGRHFFRIIKSRNKKMRLQNNCRDCDRSRQRSASYLVNSGNILQSFFVKRTFRFVHIFHTEPFCRFPIQAADIGIHQLPDTFSFICHNFFQNRFLHDFLFQYVPDLRNCHTSSAGTASSVMRPSFPLRKSLSIIVCARA